MNVRDYGYVLRRWWPVLLACTLLGGILGVVLVGGTGGQAKATSRVFASNGDADDVPAAQSTLGMQRMTTYAALVRSSRLSEKIIAELGLRRDPNELAASFVPTLEQGSVVMSVQVSAQSEDEARAILASLPRQLRALVSEVGAASAQKVPVTFSTVDGPTSSTGTPLKSLLAGAFVGLVLGAMLGALLVLARTRANPVLRSAATVAARSGLPVWGRLALPPRGTERGAPDTTEAHRIVRAVEADLGRRPSVVGVTRVRRGGHEVAESLAAAWSDRGRRVIVVDTASADRTEPAASEATLATEAPGAPGWRRAAAAVEHAARDHDVVVLALPPVPSLPGHAAWLDRLDAAVLVADQKKDRERDVIAAARDLRSLTPGHCGLTIVGAARER